MDNLLYNAIFLHYTIVRIMADYFRDHFNFELFLMSLFLFQCKAWAEIYVDQLSNVAEYRNDTSFWLRIFGIVYGIFHW